MRHIGQLPAGQARVFSDFLTSRQIRNEVERESDGNYSVWVRDEDQVAEAAAHLAGFQAEPGKAEFTRAGAEAEKVRVAEERELAAYRQRLRTRQSLFARFGSYGVGLLTYLLIVLCVVLAIFSRLGSDGEVLRHFFITDPDLSGGGVLPEVASGQVWRLVTPIFIHFGPLHLIFNLMWLYQLGCMIEGRQGALILFLIVLATALCSNAAQYFLAGIVTFGGMSGVVYGLAGYVWMRGRCDRASGLFLDRQSGVILLAWLVICYTGLVGPVANTAHVAGLLVGLAWGRVSAWVATARRN